MAPKVVRLKIPNSPTRVVNVPADEGVKMAAICTRVVAAGTTYSWTASPLNGFVDW